MLSPFKALTFAAVLTVTSTGVAAAAGKLPDPIQTVAVESASHIGVTLPDAKPDDARAKSVNERATTSTTVVKFEDSTSTTVPTAPTPTLEPAPTSIPASPTTNVCVPEPGDDSCVHPEGKGATHREDGDHRQSGKDDKTKTTSTSTSAVTAPKTEDKSSRKGGSKDDTKVTSPTTVVTATTAVEAESHKNKGGSDDD